MQLHKLAYSLSLHAACSNMIHICLTEQHTRTLQCLTTWYISKYSTLIKSSPVYLLDLCTFSNVDWSSSFSGQKKKILKNLKYTASSRFQFIYINWLNAVGRVISVVSRYFYFYLIIPDCPLQILNISITLILARQGHQTMASAAAGEESRSNLSRGDLESEGQGGLVS